MNFQTILLSPNNLYLDDNNPRFIVPQNSNEKDIISYLLETEDVLSLCIGINSYGGLIPGERIVAYSENGKYIVGEGNRRTCACKLLLNPKLAPINFIDKIPKITDKTRENITKVQIDIAKTREEAMATMGAKHIAGIKSWSPYAKMKYFYDQFNSNRTIKFISDITLTDKTKVIQQIKFYNLLLYAKSIKYFTPLERERLFNFANKEIKISIFTKALTLSYKEGIFKDKSISSLLKLDYDSNTYRVKSSLPASVFEKSIYIIAKNSLDPKISFNTRSNIDDLVDLEELLIDYKNNPDKYNDAPIDLSENTQLELPIKPKDNNINELKETKKSKSLEGTSKTQKSLQKGTNSINIKTKIVNTEKSTLEKDSSDKTPLIPAKENKRPTIPKSSERPSTPNFFTSLTWGTVDSNNPDNTGLINLCVEIQKISETNHYKKYPISAAILARALFEQTLIYYLRKDESSFKSLLKSNNQKTPQLEKIINFIKKGIDNLIKDPQLKRCFKTFADSTGNKDYFDMVIHNPHLVSADADILDSIANSGLRGFIQLVLNS